MGGMMHVAFRTRARALGRRSRLRARASDRASERERARASEGDTAHLAREPRADRDDGGALRDLPSR